MSAAPPSPKKSPNPERKFRPGYIFDTITDRLRRHHSDRAETGEATQPYPVHGLASSSHSKSTSALLRPPSLPSHQQSTASLRPEVPVLSTEPGPALSDSADADSEFTDGLAEINDLGDDSAPGNSKAPDGPGLFERIVEQLRTPYAKPVEESDPPLNVKVLRDNFRRLKNNLQFSVSPLKIFSAITNWNHPSSSILAALCYFTFVFYGCLTFGMLIMLLGGFAYTFLKKDKLLLDRHKAGSINKKTGLRNKFRVVFDVGRSVQKHFGNLSDKLEKVINLVLWEVPDNTMVVVRVLAAAAFVVAICPFSILVPIVQIAVGVKLFFIRKIFKMYPFLKKHYDSAGRFWDSLPTDADLESKDLPAGADTEKEKEPQGPEVDSAMGLDSGERVIDTFYATLGAQKGKLYVTSTRLMFLSKKADSVPVSVAVRDILKADKRGFWGVDVVLAQKPPLLFQGTYLTQFLARDLAFETIVGVVKAYTPKQD